MNFSGKFKDFINNDPSGILSLSVFLDNMKNSYGGVGANIGYTLALLGEKPILLGSIGKEASEYLQRLSSVGLNTSHIYISQLATASFNVITDKENNQVGGFYPGAMFDSESLTLEKWKKDNVFIVISPHCPQAMKRQVNECLNYNLPFCYDIGQQVANTSAEDLKFCLANPEILILNEFELDTLRQKVGESPGSLKARIPIVITTLGENGSVIEGKEVSSTIKIPGIKTQKVVDPTGAGDAYRGGFLYGYVRGWDLLTCGRMGTQAAVYAVENQGTQEHVFTKEEFICKYKDSFGEDLLLL